MKPFARPAHWHRRFLVTLLLLAGTVVQAQTPTGKDAPDGVLTGIDVLRQSAFRALEGRRVGLITNHTGIDRSGAGTARLMHDAPAVELVALFSPEHGLAGQLDIANIGHGEDPATGLPVYSLYGESRRPDADMLQGIDTLVFDIQDIGTRFYTYISTMGLAMKSAADAGLRFVVLDRPNPINGVDFDGPVVASDRLSFTAYHPLPLRHGMTVGELARMFNDELELELDLEVIALENWTRGDYFDAAGLRWVNPSPNMRNLTQALLYPGIGLLETTNLSVGRGTDTPFEIIGAPWLSGEDLAQALNRLALPGVAFVSVQFTPDASKFNGERCGGINILITHRAVFDPVRTGLEIARQLRRLYPDTWDVDAYDRLLVDGETLDAVRRGAGFDTIAAGWQAELERFARRRARYLLYD